MAKIELKIPALFIGRRNARQAQEGGRAAHRIDNRVTQAVQYLRHASGRAAIALSAFYFYFGAVVASERSPKVSHTEFVKGKRSTSCLHGRSHYAFGPSLIGTRRGS